MGIKDCLGGKRAFAEQLAARLEYRDGDVPHPSMVYEGRREAIAAYRHARTNYDELLLELSDFCLNCVEKRGVCPCGEDESIEISEFAHDMIKYAANRM